MIRILASVWAAQPSTTLSYSTHAYILGNKTKRSRLYFYTLYFYNADYTFIHLSGSLSLLYNSVISWTLVDVESYPSSEMQSAYCTALVFWVEKKKHIFIIVHLMAYQSSMVIYCQRHFSRRTVSVLFNHCWWEKVVYAFSRVLVRKWSQ